MDQSETEYTSKEREGVGAMAHVCGEAGGIKSEWDVKPQNGRKTADLLGAPLWVLSQAPGR